MSEDNKKNHLSHTVLYWWQKCPDGLCTSLEANIWVSPFPVQAVLHYTPYILTLFDRPLTPVTVCDPAAVMGSGSLWICCCHSCRVYTSNWESSQHIGDHLLSHVWDPLTPNGILFPGMDGTATPCPQNTSPPPALWDHQRTIAGDVRGTGRKWARTLMAWESWWKSDMGRKGKSFLWVNRSIDTLFALWLMRIYEAVAKR